MSLVSQVRERVRALVFRAREDAERDEELRFHLEMETEKNLRAGMSPEEARRQARLAFGGIERVHAEVHDARGLGWLEVAWSNVRYALRGLRLNPGFTVTLVLTLALGISATVVMFSIVDALLLRPLPYHRPGELVQVETVRPGGGTNRYVPWEDFRTWSEPSGVFESAMAHVRHSLLFTGGAEPKMLSVQGVTASFTQVLGVRPTLGRGFLKEDAEPGAPPVAVLDHAFWRSAFGADPGVLGRTIELDGEPYQVIGVMPQGFKFPQYATTELWLPIHHDGTFRGEPAAVIEILARIGREPIERVQARADALADALGRVRPRDQGWAIRLQHFEATRGRGVHLREAVGLLSGAVGLLLLVALVNAATLLLMRGWSRARELAVRVALGASRGRLIGQLLTESLVLALLSGVVATLLAFVGLRALRGLIPESISFFAPFAIDLEWRALAFAFSVTVVAGVLIGILPALRATRLGSAAAEAGLTPYATSTPVKDRLRRGLIVCEVTLTVILLIGAGLLINSFVRLVTVEPGFRTENIAVMQLSLSEVSYPTSQARAAFLRRLAERLEGVPGVDAVVVNGRIPPAGGFFVGVMLEAEGEPTRQEGQPQLLPHTHVPPNFFDVLDVPMVMGRSFAAEDAGADHVIIDHGLARFLWGEASPIGRRFRIRPDSPWLTVVGVVGALRSMGPDDRAGSFALLYPLGPDEAPSYVPLAIRTHGDPRTLLPTFRGVTHELDPRLPIHDLRTGRELYAATVDMPRFLLVLMSILSSVALVLAAVGIYGVLAFAVVQRRRELGIRIALGAPLRRVSWGVLREGVLLAGLGTAAGIVIAMGLSRVIRALLYGVEPTDPATLAAAVLVSLSAAALACYVPARRATKVDPIEVLRVE